MILFQITNCCVFLHDMYILVGHVSPVSYKTRVSNTYPYSTVSKETNPPPNGRLQVLVSYFTSVVTVSFKRLPSYCKCTWLHFRITALYWLQYHGSSLFSHLHGSSLFSQLLITVTVVIKGLGDLNTEVVFSVLHLQADLNPE